MPFPTTLTGKQIKLCTGITAYLRSDGTVCADDRNGFPRIHKSLEAAEYFAQLDAINKAPKSVTYLHRENIAVIHGTVFHDAPKCVQAQWVRPDDQGYLLGDFDYIWYTEDSAHLLSNGDLAGLINEFVANTNLLLDGVDETAPF